MFETVGMEKFRSYPRQKTWRAKSQGHMTALDRIRERLQQEVDARQSGLIPQDSGPAPEDRGTWTQSAIRHAPLKHDRPGAGAAAAVRRGEDRSPTAAINRYGHLRRDATAAESFGAKRTATGATFQKPVVGRRSSLEHERKVRAGLVKPRAQNDPPARRECAFQQKLDTKRNLVLQSTVPPADDAPTTEVEDLSGDVIQDEVFVGEGKESTEDATLETHQDGGDGEVGKTEERTEANLRDSDAECEDYFKSREHLSGFINKDAVIRDEELIDSVDSDLANNVENARSDAEKQDVDEYSLALSGTEERVHDETDKQIEINSKSEHDGLQDHKDMLYSDYDVDLPRKGVLSPDFLQGYIINNDEDTVHKDWTHVETSEDDSTDEDTSDHESSPELHIDKPFADQAVEEEDDDVFTPESPLHGKVSEEYSSEVAPDAVAEDDVNELPERSISLLSEPDEEKNTLNDSIEYNVDEPNDEVTDEFVGDVTPEFSAGNLGKYLIRNNVCTQRNVVTAAEALHTEVGDEALSVETTEEKVIEQSDREHSVEADGITYGHTDERIFRLEHAVTVEKHARLKQQEEIFEVDITDQASVAVETLAQKEETVSGTVFQDAGCVQLDNASDIHEDSAALGKDPSENIDMVDYEPDEAASPEEHTEVTANLQSNNLDFGNEVFEKDAVQKERFIEDLEKKFSNQESFQGKTSYDLECAPHCVAAREDHAQVDLGRLNEMDGSLGDEEVAEDSSSKRDTLEDESEAHDDAHQPVVVFRVDPARPWTLLQFLFRYVIVKHWRAKSKQCARSGRPLGLFLLSLLSRCLGTVGLFALLCMFRFLCACVAICIAIMIYAPYILSLLVFTIGRNTLERYGHYTSEDVKKCAWWLLGKAGQIAMVILKHLAVLSLRALKLLKEFLVRKIKESRYAHLLKKIS